MFKGFHLSGNSVEYSGQIKMTLKRDEVKSGSSSSASASSAASDSVSRNFASSSFTKRT